MKIVRRLYKTFKSEPDITTYHLVVLCLLKVNNTHKFIASTWTNLG